MASFQAPNYIPQFSSYIPQYNTELYANLITQRQQQYDQNLQKVKNYQQSVYGIQTARDIDAQYVQKAGDQLTSQLQQLAGADFAKEEVLSQAGSMASKIYGDRNIQNIAISTQNFHDANQKIEQVHKDGKSGISNDHAILRNIQAWQQGDINATLGKQVYTDFFDYQKGFQDFMKDKHGNVVVEQNPFSKNEDGSPNWNAYALVEGKKVYLDPMSVAQDVQTYFASNAQAKGQLDIDGLYYSDMTPNDVAFRNFQEQNRSDLSKYDNIISQLEAQKKIDNGNSSDIDARISQYQDAKTKAITLYRQRESDFLANPQSAKIALYQQSIAQGFANRFAYQDLEQKIIKNPIFEGQIEEQKLALATEKFKFERDTWQQEFGLKMSKQKLDEREFEQKYGISATGQGLTEGGYTEYTPTPEEVLEQTRGLEREVKQNQLKTMYDMGLTQNVFLGRDANGNPLYVYQGNDSDFQKAWGTLENNYQSNPQGANPYLKKYFQDETSTTSGIGKQRAYLAQRDQLNKLENQLDSQFNNNPGYRNYKNKIASLGDLNQVILTENGNSITRGDIIKYSQYQRDNKFSKSSNAQQIASQTGLSVEQATILRRYIEHEIEGRPILSFIQSPTAIVSDFFGGSSPAANLRKEFKKVYDVVNDSNNEAYSNARKQAYKEITYNQPTINLTLSPDGSNAKAVEDKSAQILTIARSQGLEKPFNEVFTDKKGKLTVGARVDPLSHRIYAFATNTNGNKVAEMELSPVNARQLFPQLTIPNKYSSVLDRLNANRPQKGVASTTGKGGEGAYSPQNSNLNNYSLRAQFADDGQGNVIPIIEYKAKNGSQWSQITQPSFFSTVEEADQYFQKVASLNDAVFENTFLK